VPALEHSRGLRAPLFERLIDDGPKASSGGGGRAALSGSALTRSIGAEVSRLLNTRCAYPLAEVERGARTILEYGLPDLSNYSPADDSDRRLLARAIHDTIAAYEPRLSAVRVEVVAADPRRATLGINVSGQQGAGSFVEPVSFPVVIHEFETLERTELEMRDG
jgi:type VI secretion system protein ImpF